MGKAAAAIKVDAAMMGSTKGIGARVNRAENVWPKHISTVRDVVKEVKEKAGVVKEQIHSFNERIGPALQEAMAFSEMMKRQNDYYDNALPEDIYNGSGTIISNLALAKRYGVNLLKKEADELDKYASLVAAKFAAAPIDPQTVVVVARSDLRCRRVERERRRVVALSDFL